MAGDKPGEELAHDATIWKLYLEEAEEHDQELVKSRHGSLDMLLLFAALFSAILTAFLIESKDLLQQDPADASAALLLMVVQSQQRIELGLPSPVVTPLKDLPAFVPLASARWINGIWFTSLALSLSAALIAMLGKEWLTAYLASRPRPPHSHALLRQARLEGLEGWWALHIIALLPSLLHASLFLFAVGLVLYLWTLDAVVAGVMAGIIGITTLFYVVTAVLGAIYEHCPFVTQVSSYIKRAVDRYFRHQSQNEDHTGVTSVKDIQALLWLANKARDPAVVDCSFQALAGLRLSSKQADSASNQANPDSPSQTPPSLPMQINTETTSLLLFCTVADRFERAMANPLLSSVADGLNLARYAAATVRLFKSLPPLQEDVLDNELNGHGLSVTGRIESNDRPRDATVKPMVRFHTI
ncbi:hypothetical protein BDV93DRAFT_303848 [Ceratobasidium sp. AG-I]|nr:hypothetical protein BDV93DRAFT_303848 [Ceratobasidium sp. AG-I]